MDKSDVQLCDELKKALARSSCQYLADRKLIDQILKTSERKAALRKIIKSAEKFVKSLEVLDDSTEQLINNIISERVCSRKVYSIKNDVSKFCYIGEELLNSFKKDNIIKARIKF